MSFSFLTASDAIGIDGLWSDWDSVPIAVIDQENDYNGDDWAELKISNPRLFLSNWMTYIFVSLSKKYIKATIEKLM